LRNDSGRDPVSRAAPNLPDGEPSLFLFRFYEADIRGLTHPTRPCLTTLRIARPKAAVGDSVALRSSRHGWRHRRPFGCLPLAWSLATLADAWPKWQFIAATGCTVRGRFCKRLRWITKG